MSLSARDEEDLAKSVTLDGVTYELEDLSSEAIAHLESLQFAENQIARLQAELAIYQTARNAYRSALEQLLPHTKQ